MKRGIVLAVAGAAGVLILALVLATSVAPPSGEPPPRPVVKGEPKAAREGRAEALFARAQLAADRRDWAAARRHLQQLLTEYDGTRFVGANRFRIARMQAEVEARLQDKAQPPPKGLPAKAPERRPLTIEEARQDWPVVFQAALAAKDCLKRAWVYKGQYGGHVRVAKALKVSGMHTISAAWWQQPVGGRVLLSVDVRAVDNARPWIWLCGPGYGTAPSLGYRLQMIMGTPKLDLLVTRQGRALGPKPDGPPLQWGEWYRLEVLCDGGDIAVSLDGRRLGRWRDPRPLVGPMHRFVALGSHLGLSGNSGAWYRDLALRMPPGEAERLAEHPLQRVFDPPVTLPPLPNGKRLAEEEFAARGLDGWSGTKPAWGVHVREQGLVLSGPNCWPRPWRNEPVTGNFVLDVPMRYFPNGEAVNFEVRLRVGEFVDAKKDRYTGWGVTFPAGDGVVAIHWHDEQGNSRRLATSGYFAPTHGRRYMLRVERVGDRLRLFANGGYLAEAGAPVQVPIDQPVYIGFRQIYGGSIVERLVVSRIGHAAPPGLMRGAPGEMLDTGPTLAAAAHFRDALRRHVHPALADREYVDGQVALTRLSVRPEFELAGAAIAHAERDVDRLLRFWTVARPRVEQNPRQDVLALLGPDFLSRDPAEHRLQAALFLLYDKDGDPKRALRVLEPLSTLPDACRVRDLAARRRAQDAGAD